MGNYREVKGRLDQLITAFINLRLYWNMQVKNEGEIDVAFASLFMQRKNRIVEKINYLKQRLEEESLSEESISALEKNYNDLEKDIGFYFGTAELSDSAEEEKPGAEQEQACEQLRSCLDFMRTKNLTVVLTELKTFGAFESIFNRCKQSGLGREDLASLFKNNGFFINPKNGSIVRYIDSSHFFRPHAEQYKLFSKCWQKSYQANACCSDKSCVPHHMEPIG